MRLQYYLSVLIALGGLFLIPSSRGQSALNSYVAPNIEITVKTADGKPVPEETLVELIDLNGRLYDQKSLRNGKARFDQVPKNEFRVLVMAPGYQRAEKPVDVSMGVLLAKVSMELQPMEDAEDAASDVGLSSLSPKVQREIGKALEALRKKKPTDARKHLETAQRQVPNSAEVEYLFGIYALQVKDTVEAQAHWKKTLEFNPNHLSALLEVAQGFLAEKKSAEAMPYLNRALAVEPSSWRANALLAEADYLEGNRDEAIKRAERALDLGHEQAALLEPLLAAALAESGEAGRAISILENYLKANPSDTEAGKQLERLRKPESAGADRGAPGTRGATSFSRMNAKALELPIRSNWLPPDVDDRVPVVEPEAVCSLDEILPKVADQLVTLIRNVDHFTATETVADETINKWGVVSSSEKRKFDYLVSIEQISSGRLIVDEYRSDGGKPAQFPDGFITNGLPALVMVFHPSYVGSYDMRCEGLARRSEGLAWQVHFRQRSDKAAAIRGFQVGHGSSHPAALKGRAWISAETYQIVRLETDLVRPMPEIRLLAEHTAIEYGSVSFREGNTKLWLPRSAEVHFEWMGQRIHRRHSFDNYMFFSIEEKERIGSPKNVGPVNSPERHSANSRP